MFLAPKVAQSMEKKFTKQLGSTDPERLFENHLRVNNPGTSDHLFANKHNTGKKTMKHPLTIYKTRLSKNSQGSQEPRTHHPPGPWNLHLEYLLKSQRCLFRCGQGNWRMEK